MNAKLMVQCAAMVVISVFGCHVRAQTALNDDGIQSVSSCRVIDRPGSYALTRNITARQQDLKPSPAGVGGPSCVVIVADFVTLDLRGFAITGPGTGNGVYATQNSVGRFSNAVAVRNGSVRNFDRGISFEGASHAAADVRLISNGTGLTFDGINLSAERVQSLLNNGDGILCFGGFGNSVRNTGANQNGANGINLSACLGSSVIGNLASANGGVGIVAACPSVVLQNSSFQNAAGEIRADGGSCTRSDNNPAP